MIKLLALDLDGTLLNSQGTISEENIKAIRNAEDHGVLVTIASGRRFRDARPVALEIGLNAPVICHNGALIKYAETLETVDVTVIPAQTTRDIIFAGKEFGGEALVSIDPHGKGTLLYETISEDNIPLQRYVVWSKKLHGDEAEEAVHHVTSLADLIDEIEVVHISYSGNCSTMNILQENLDTSLEGSASIMATIYPHLDFTLLDILPPNTSKATAIRKLAEMNGLSSANVMVIGDNFNDLDMLEYAGLPVVMGNADASLLQREEFYTTLGNDENGVAAAINKYILGDING
ncbi:MAG: HAD family phosphatase [Acidobacteria bacterium]|nr:HAD family phosphatase [Acidobacteriota bacterium]